MEAIHL